jgi:hypothetical protein
LVAALKLVGATLALSERSLCKQSNLVAHTHSQARLNFIVKDVWLEGYAETF